MASIYQKRDWWYLHGDDGRNRALKTKDRSEAERVLVEVKARALGLLPETQPGGVAQQVERLTFNQRVTGSSPVAPTAPPSTLDARRAFDQYLARKRGGIKPATREAYRGHVRHILARLGNPPIAQLTTERLQDYADAEVRRLGSPNTVVKRFESLIKPALRLAYHLQQLGRLPLFPQLRTRRRSGDEKHAFTRGEFAALRAELPEVDTLETGAGLCYPRLWADIAVCTGLHDSDANAFGAADYDPARCAWFRHNEKRADMYPDEWFPCDPLLRAALDAALAARPRLTLFVTDTPHLPKQWMRRRLASAARRAGLAWTPTPIDFRRTFATWRREEGWEFEETAKVLGNSSGIVREVYAQVMPASIVRAYERSSPHAAALLKLTRDLEGPRRSPKAKKTTSDPGRKPGRISPTTTELSHGKLSYRGGGPTD